jgi:phosphatidate cytidylyltransferase
VFPVTSLIPNVLIQFVAGFVTIIIFVSVLTSNFEKNDGLIKAVFATFYPTIPLLSLVLLNVQGSAGIFFLITALSIPSFTDVGAYLLGSKLKGPKLCPHISPNKTISGAVGGLICGVIATLLTYFVLRGLNIDVFKGMKTINIVIFLIVSGIFLSVVAQIGDLVESYIKRRIGIKDMGNIIPGHGGMLDRVDGIAFTSLFTFVIYSLIL